MMKCVFFRLNSLVKIIHLKHFWCQQRATPRMTGLKAFPKNAISLDRGKREVAWEPKLLYLDSPTILNFWGLSRKMSFFPKVLFLKSSTVFCMLVMFTRGGTAETVEIK